MDKPSFATNDKPLSRVDRALNRAFNGPGAELAQRQADELYALAIRLEAELLASSSETRRADVHLWRAFLSARAAAIDWVR